MPHYKEVIDDFGFSFEEDLLPQKDMVLQETAEQEKFAAEMWKVNEWRAQQLRNKIETLLINLEKNPEKEIIRWPNRLEAVKKFRGELELILTSFPPDPNEQ